jgi:hypothetical protein
MPRKLCRVPDAYSGVCCLQAAARVKHYAMDSAIQAQQAAAEAARKQANQVLIAYMDLRVPARNLPDVLGAATQSHLCRRCGGPQLHHIKSCAQG